MNTEMTPDSEEQDYLDTQRRILHEMRSAYIRACVARLSLTQDERALVAETPDNPMLGVRRVWAVGHGLPERSLDSLPPASFYGFAGVDVDRFTRL